VVDSTVTIRQATSADIPELVRLRRTMFEAMGYQDPEILAASDVASAAYFATAIPAGTFHGWLAVTPTGLAVASGGVVIDQHPPGPANLSGQIGYIMNLVTDPCYRLQGIARRMMETMLEWLAQLGIQRVTLHATKVGRSLYEELGFVPSNELQLESRWGL
jgi:GNAT superfamily N-acetyltransferase